MATKDISKMRGLTVADLDKEERQLRDEIWKLGLQRSTGQLQDPYKVRKARRDLARVLTVKREMELAAAKQAGR